MCHRVSWYVIKVLEMLYLWDFPKIYTKKKTWYKNFEFIPFLYHGPEKTCVFMRRNDKLIKK